MLWCHILRNLLVCGLHIQCTQRQKLGQNVAPGDAQAGLLSSLLLAQTVLLGMLCFRG